MNYKILVEGTKGKQKRKKRRMSKSQKLLISKAMKQRWQIAQLEDRTIKNVLKTAKH